MNPPGGALPRPRLGPPRLWRVITTPGPCLNPVRRAPAAAVEGVVCRPTPSSLRLLHDLQDQEGYRPVNNPRAAVARQRPGVGPGCSLVSRPAGRRAHGRAVEPMPWRRNERAHARRRLTTGAGASLEPCGVEPLPSVEADRRPEGPLPRIQTHALYGSNQAAPEDPAPHTSTGSPAPSNRGVAGHEDVLIPKCSDQDRKPSHVLHLRSEGRRLRPRGPPALGREAPAASPMDLDALVTTSRRHRWCKRCDVR
jgi:hypothetical protein